MHRTGTMQRWSMLMIFRLPSSLSATTKNIRTWWGWTSDMRCLLFNVTRVQSHCLAFIVESDQLLFQFQPVVTLMFNRLINTSAFVCYFILFTCLLQKPNWKRDVPNIYTFGFMDHEWSWWVLFTSHSEFPFCPSLCPRYQTCTFFLVVFLFSEVGKSNSHPDAVLDNGNF